MGVFKIIIKNTDTESADLIAAKMHIEAIYCIKPCENLHFR